MGLKIAVFGVGHLGKIHIKCIQMIPELELIGFFDPLEAHATKVEENGIPRFQDADELIEQTDIVDIVTPTKYHFEIAKKAIEKGKHVFIEKPICSTVEEAQELIELNKSKQVKVQIGHVERFNPVFLSMKEQVMNPMFIEGHRLAIFNPRGTDVSVVQDLMIHDIDLVLHIVNQEISHISASGVKVLSDTPDICNARIEFVNGCVANLTASRISMKQMRKLRMFQPDAYLSLDFLDKKLEIIRMLDEEAAATSSNPNLLTLETNDKKRWIDVNFPEIPENNAIKEELLAFCKCILEDHASAVDMMAGMKALEVANKIMEAVESRAKTKAHDQV